MRDLEGQNSVVKKLSLACPVLDIKLAKDIKLAMVPSEIDVIPDRNLVLTSDYRSIVGGFDVIQIAAKKPWWAARKELQFLSAAKHKKICLIVGISSNRAKTALINAKRKGILRVAKSWIIFHAINYMVKYFSQQANGVFVVGEGLVELVKAVQENIYVNTASWIKAEEILSQENLEKKTKNSKNQKELQLCVATRLEQMKGVHIAVDALQILKSKTKQISPTLLILGEGEELSKLKHQVNEFSLQDRIVFAGVYSYPDRFFEKIRPCDLMLLTNLNNEQPRLVFDAISQGVVPICPDTLPFKTLKFDPRVYYEVGNPESLASKISEFNSIDVYNSTLENLAQAAKEYTVEAMHEKRAFWIDKTLSDYQANLPKI